MKTALRVNVDCTTEVLDLDGGEYEQLSGAVGGLIERVDLRPGLTIWVNEEGKLDQLPVNIIGSHLWEKSFGMTDVIVGNCVFTGNANEDGETESLTNVWVEQISGLAAKLRAALEGQVTVH